MDAMAPDSFRSSIEPPQPRPRPYCPPKPNQGFVNKQVDEAKTLGWTDEIADLCCQRVCPPGQRCGVDRTAVQVI